MLILGSSEGLHRVEEIPFDSEDVETVLECGKVTEIRQDQTSSDIYATSASGLYRSSDGGDTWEDLNVPQTEGFWTTDVSEVWSSLVTSDGTIYAGTNDPYLYRSKDNGESWHELRGFRQLPSRGEWESPLDPYRARLRSLDSPPGHPNVVIAGVESGGVHISRDAGETWSDLRDVTPDDIHHVMSLSPEVHLCATGFLDLKLEHLNVGHGVGEGGIYRTNDGGESWKRLDVNNQFSYIRRLFRHEGNLFFCGSTEAPPLWSQRAHEAVLFESNNFGRSFERVSYPGEPDNVVEDWTILDDDIIGVSSLFDVPRPPEDIVTSVFRRTEEGEYESVGEFPAMVGSIQAV